MENMHPQYLTSPILEQLTLPIIGTLTTDPAITTTSFSECLVYIELFNRISRSYWDLSHSAKQHSPTNVKIKRITKRHVTAIIRLDRSNSLKHAIFSHLYPRPLKTYEDIFADLAELLFDLLPVLLGHLLFLLTALGLLFDAGDDPPRAAARAHHVLVGHRQQVTLLVTKLVACDSGSRPSEAHVPPGDDSLRSRREETSDNTRQIIPSGQQPLLVLFSTLPYKARHHFIYSNKNADPQGGPTLWGVRTHYYLDYYCLQFYFWFSFTAYVRTFRLHFLT